MTTRVGVDVHDVHEVAATLTNFGVRYLTRVFNSEEVMYAHAHPGNAAAYLAGRFAAREAVVKLLRLEDALTPWQVVSIHGNFDARVELQHEALLAATDLGITNILLCIDYGQRFATAIAVADVTTIYSGGLP
jgi:holo-[acyl-carrier protein] synthase